MTGPRCIESKGKRKCSRCEKWAKANAENFTKSASCRGGITSICRSCSRSYLKKWKTNRKDQLAKRRKELYHQNEKNISAKHEREQWLADPHRMRAKQMKKSMQLRHRQKGIPLDSRYFSIKKLAQMLTETPICPCCSKVMEPGQKLNGAPYDNAPSVDRIKPALGYVEGNVAILCWRCNNLKRDATTKELEQIISWMKKVS